MRTILDMHLCTQTEHVSQRVFFRPAVCTRNDHRFRRVILFIGKHDRRSVIIIINIIYIIRCCFITSSHARPPLPFNRIVSRSTIVALLV